MSGIEPLSDLKKTILELILVLKDNMLTRPDEQGDLMMVEFFFERMHVESIMQHAIKNILPYKKYITNRNQNFFLENKKIFGGLPDDRVEHYANLVATSDRLDDDDREEIWEFFDVIISLVELYRKKK